MLYRLRGRLKQNASTPRPHYTSPEKFESAALFLLFCSWTDFSCPFAALSLLSLTEKRQNWKISEIMIRTSVHSNPSRKRKVFRERSSNRKYLQTPALPFIVNGKQFEKGAFQKRRVHESSDFRSRPSFPQT